MAAMDMKNLLTLLFCLMSLSLFGQVAVRELNGTATGLTLNSLVTNNAVTAPGAGNTNLVGVSSSGVEVAVAIPSSSGSFASPTTYYLSLGGNDTNAGTSPIAPLLTLTNALTLALPGYKIHAEAGYYPMPTLASATGAAGTNALPMTNYVTFTGDGAGVPFLFNGLAFPTNTTVSINASNSFRFENNDIIERVNFLQSGQGLYPFGVANNSTATNDVIRDCSGWGYFSFFFRSDGSPFGFTNNPYTQSMIWEGDYLSSLESPFILNSTNTADYYLIKDCRLESRGTNFSIGDVGGALSPLEISPGYQGTVVLSGGILVATNAYTGSSTTDTNVGMIGIYSTNAILYLSPAAIEMPASSTSASYYDLVVAGKSNTIYVLNDVISPGSIYYASGFPASGNKIYFPNPVTQSGVTNVSFSSVTNLTIPLSFLMPSSNYVASITDDGAAISGLSITNVNTTNFSAIFTSLSFTGNVFWWVQQMGKNVGGP
jgi:hypothetical protein